MFADAQQLSQSTNPGKVLLVTCELAKRYGAVLGWDPILVVHVNLVQKHFLLSFQFETPFANL